MIWTHELTLVSEKKISDQYLREVLVFELSRRRLNTFPSVRNRMGDPKSFSWNASLSMAENTNVNNMGAITQPCCRFRHRSRDRTY